MIFLISLFVICNVDNMSSLSFVVNAILSQGNAENNASDLAEINSPISLTNAFLPTGEFKNASILGYNVLRITLVLFFKSNKPPLLRIHYLEVVKMRKKKRGK